MKSTDALDQAQLGLALSTLRLPTFRQICPAMAARAENERLASSSAGATSAGQ